MSIAEEFETFWQRFPRRTAKLAAKQAYVKARTMASAEEILEGIERYKRMKPSYADYCHPRTFLSQGRWLDEPDEGKREWVCPHDPPCLARNLCYVQIQIAEGKKLR